ncbi:tetratricopeptide repeat domain protein [Aspergillus terreus]|uniref:ER membrane protein complex subunit 2 n=1 Tax=Aspergillus terreus TaxID=33178 RepID=A0A8H3MWB1_ASPTE|nr:tetratricopeptide repeat domain protein [Aspergillus terreus]
MTSATSEPHALDHANLISTLHFSQKAPVILDGKSGSDNPETYDTLEQLFLSCLQTGDDQSALRCLDQLTHRFGASNERIQGLRGLYQEATAGKQSDLEDCLRKYDEALAENPMNLPILKRRISLLRSLSKPAEAISALVELLKAVPTDSESWCELADLYLSESMVSQAVFCLEEALLLVPNAWNIHARLGEVLYIGACSSDGETSSQLLERSIRYFCRSIELCDHYLRGLYGLALATSPFSKNKRSSGPPQKPMAVFVSNESFEKLHEFAIGELQSIVEQRSLNRQNWAFAQGELIAAKELLDRMGNSS